MIAASMGPCREVRFGGSSSSNVLATRMQSRVPRCLFGSPSPKETVEMFQDALDTERRRFASRWGVDPCSEDKENFQRKFERAESRSPRKSRNAPYARQTNIHDYWRTRKNYDVSKKVLSASTDCAKTSHDGQNSTSSK